jgi:hypothetical protein
MNAGRENNFNGAILGENNGALLHLKQMRT